MGKMSVSVFVTDIVEKFHCEWAVLELFKRGDSSTGLFEVFKECGV